MAGRLEKPNLPFTTEEEYYEWIDLVILNKGNTTFANTIDIARALGALIEVRDKFNDPAELNEIDPSVPEYVKNISISDIAGWISAYNWGDHNVAGYLKEVESDSTLTGKGTASEPLSAVSEDIIVVTDITGNTNISDFTTLDSNKIYRFINRSGNTYTLSTTVVTDKIEGEDSVDIYDGETFDITITGNNARL